MGWLNPKQGEKAFPCDISITYADGTVDVLHAFVKDGDDAADKAQYWFSDLIQKQPKRAPMKIKEIRLSMRGSDGKMDLEQERLKHFSRVESELAITRMAEKLTSDAYLRIRKLVNAFDTQDGGTDRFEVTEKKIQELVDFRNEISVALSLSSPDDGAAEIDQVRYLIERLKKFEAFEEHARASHSLPDICCPELPD